jgi:hypothetical protein
VLGESLKVSAFALMLGLLRSWPIRPICVGSVLFIVDGDDLRFVYIYRSTRLSCDGGCQDTLLAAVAVTKYFVFAMPHATSDDDNGFKHIQVKELHPTFGAEVYGVDFSKPVPEDVFSEIYKTITRVSIIHCFVFLNRQTTDCLSILCSPMSLRPRGCP